MIQQIFECFPKVLNGLVLVDRDGTLIHDNGYFHNYRKIEFIEQNSNIYQNIYQHNFGLVLVTNQSGIGRGIFGIEDTIKVHQALATEIKKLGGQLHSAIFCPHTPEDKCLCRKPNPMMLLHIAAQTNLSHHKMAFFGNTVSDKRAALNANIAYYSTVEEPFSTRVSNWLEVNFSIFDNPEKK